MQKEDCFRQKLFYICVGQPFSDDINLFLYTQIYYLKELSVYTDLF